MTAVQSGAVASNEAGTLPIRYLETEIRMAEPVEISEGVVLARLPLPFALNHINVYLIDDADGWTLVDCGLEAEKSRECWEKILASPLVANRPIRRIIVTHHHPDHIGLAGWLNRRFDAPVHMSKGELGVAGRYADPSRDIVSERMGFWTEHGLPPDVSTWLMERMPRYSKHVHVLPPDVRIVDPTLPIEIGGRSWRLLVGRGHSPEHLSLYEPETGVLIGGDQLLPEITPNIGVWPGGDQNPLRSYLESLVQFRELPGDPLLLPSHRQPLRGVQRRVEELRVHHDERLDQVLAKCDEPMSCYQLLNALFGRPLRNEEVGFGLGEGVAHLNYLESLGKLRSSVDSGGVRRFELVRG